MIQTKYFWIYWIIIKNHIVQYLNFKNKLYNKIFYFNLFKFNWIFYPKLTKKTNYQNAAIR